MLNLDVKREGSKEIMTITLERSVHTLNVYSKQMYENLVQEEKLVFEDASPIAQEGVKAVVIIHPIGEKPRTSSVIFVADDVCMTLDSFVSGVTGSIKEPNEK